jgi:hypothetical protein
VTVIWEFLSDPGKHYAIAWGVTLTCVLIAYVASKALRDNPRLFTAMALLACAWVLVLGAYGAREARPLAYLVTDIASFLLVYVGVLLALESPQGRGLVVASWLQRGAFWLLLAIVLPRQLQFPSLLQLPPVSLDQFEIGAGLVLALLGFLSLAFGAWHLGGLGFLRARRGPRRLRVPERGTHRRYLGRRVRFQADVGILHLRLRGRQALAHMPIRLCAGAPRQRNEV